VSYTIALKETWKLFAYIGFILNLYTLMLGMYGI